MRILAIDVSVSGCSVAFLDMATNLSSVKRLETDRGQAEHLVPMIDETIRSANTTLKDLDAIAVTRGPGSFTGVRIGLSTAKTLGLALDIPVFGFSTLDVIARKHASDTETLFLIDTKRDDFYGQVGEGSEPRIWSIDDAQNFKGKIVKDDLPDILILARMGAEIYDGQKGYDLSLAPTPLYLREAEVSTSKKQPLQIL